MGNSSKEISLKEKLPLLKAQFLRKGYPLNSLEENLLLHFTYQNHSFLISLPLIIKEDLQTLLVVDLKFNPSLISLERGILALARLLFKPWPYFALLTNFVNYHLIEVSSGQCLRGSEEVIPNYSEIKKCSFLSLKSFPKELEERILAIYLSEG
ncbi:MAG: hypothetical protein RMI74_06375 [Thermodesulfobacterium sp.]|nr:hypothetical protein [Thermodesulfobacterium sp.]